MVETSMICRLFRLLWAVLAGAWEGSHTGRALCALGGGAAVAVRKSAVCRFLWREGAIPKGWRESVACKALTVLLNLPGTLCQAVYRAGKKLWDGSAVFRWVTWVCSKPFFLLGICLAVMLMTPHAWWDNRYGLYMALALTVLFWLGMAARPKARLEPDALGPYYILFMEFIVYAFLSSLDWKLSLRFVGFHLAAFLLCLLAVSAIQCYEDLELVCALAVGGLTVAALYGCYQGAVGVEVVANQQDLALNAGMPGRVFAFFDNPNNFAELLVMLAPLTCALFLNARTLGGKLCAVCSFAVCAVALGLTYSRSGWLGMALAAVVFIAVWNWRALPLLMVLGVLAVPLLPKTIYNRILTIGNTKDTSTNYRFAIYETSGVLMRDYWYRGVGLGSDVLQRTFKDYPPMFDGNWPIHTHNNYLQMWAETGILGALAFLAALFYQLKEGVRAVASCRDARLRNLLGAALAGFCGVALISLAEYTWFYARNMFIYFFLFGLIASGIKLTKAAGDSGGRTY